MLKSPMLAYGPMSDEKIERLLPLFAQPKLDGIRMMASGGVGWARSLKEIPNYHLQHRIVIWRDTLQGLDGELIAGEPTDQLARNRTHKAVMARMADDPDVRWYVYDSWEHGGTFEERLFSLTKRANDWPGWVRLVETRECLTMDDVRRCEEHFLSLGYEGMILRRPSSLYRNGRATSREGQLIKVKRFLDTEAEVVDFVEEMHNSNEASLNELGYQERSSHKAGLLPKGRLGALVAKGRFPDGREYTVRIGTGFTHEQREEFWASRHLIKGQLVTFKYLPIGVKDAPVNPVFVGFRDRLDTDEGPVEAQQKELF